MRDESVEAEIQSRWPEWFAICEDVRGVILRVVDHIEIDRKDERKLFLAAIYAKISNSFFPAIEMLKAGYAQEAGAITRVIVESVFILQASYLDEDFRQKYLETDLITREKHLSASLDHADRHGFTNSFYNKVRQELPLIEQEIKERGVKGYKLNKVAGIAKLDDMYDLTYRYLCTYCSHPTVRCIDESVKVDQSSGELYLLIGPSVSDASFILFSLAQSLLIATNTMSILFSLQLEQYIEKKFNEIKELGKVQFSR